MSEVESGTHIQGPVYGLVQGEYNTITFIFQDGRERAVPFLAPPRPAYDLVGRKDTLAKMKNRLFSGNDLCLSALSGLPGVGKTALAIALAYDRDVLDHFHDGVLWAGLGRMPNLLTSITSWAKALDVSPQGISDTSQLEQWAEAVHTAIGLRHMLIVIDDAWEEGSALTLQLGGPNCSHLVTTRIPEVALTFAGGELTTVQELNTTDSLELLSRFVPDVVRAEPEAVLALARMTGGLPLALTLIGSYMRRQSHSGRIRKVLEAIERLQATTERLGLAEPQTLLGRHPGIPPGASLSLFAVINTSYEALGPAARQTLLSLSVFPPKPSTFSEAAARAVSAATLTALDDLFDQGLLESVGTDRCTLHQTISDYARSQNSDRTAMGRMITYFLGYVEENTFDYAAIESELPNILKALRLADSLHRTSELRRMTVALFPFLDRSGLYELGENYLKLALDATTGDPSDEESGHILYCLGKITDRRGELEKAEDYLMRSLEIIRDYPRSHLLPDVLVGLGWVVGMRGRLPEAANYFQEAGTRAHSIGLSPAEAAALQGLGWARGLQGNYPESITSLRQGVEISRRVGDPDVTADVLQVLGYMYLMSGGDLKEPEQSFRECLAIARETGRTDRLIDALQGLGSVEWRNCRYATASSYIQEAIGIARKAGHRELMALLTHLGAILRDTGDLQGAKLCLEEGLALTLRFGHQEKISAALSLLGDVERRLGEVGSARLHLLQALDIARDHDFHERLVEALKNLGRLSRVDGNAAAAEAYLEEGLRLTVNRSDAAHRSELLLAVAELRFEQQDLEAARDSFTQAAELARNANRQELVALSYYGLARVARSSGDTSTADQLGHASFDVLREIGYCDVNEVQAWLTHEDR